MSKTKWPATVPVLSAEDFCQGVLVDGSRRCTLGWLGEVFAENKMFLTADLAEIQPLDDAVRLAARELKKPITEGSVASWNDRLPASLLARVWNRATAKLGYVVGNPEARHLTHPQP